MIVSQRLILRPWQESDIEFLQMLRNDVDLQAQLLAVALGSSTSQVRQWLKVKSKGPDRLFFVVELNSSKKPIGYIQLTDETGATKTVRFGICLAAHYWSQGYGSEVHKAVEAHLRSQHGTHKMILNVDEANIRAVNCYRKLDYRTVGVLQRHVNIQGRLRDVLIMEKWIL